MFTTPRFATPRRPSPRRLRPMVQSLASLRSPPLAHRPRVLPTDSIQNRARRSRANTCRAVVAPQRSGSRRCALPEAKRSRGPFRRRHLPRSISGWLSSHCMVGGPRWWRSKTNHAQYNWEASKRSAKGSLVRKFTPRLMMSTRASGKSRSIQTSSCRDFPVR